MSDDTNDRSRFAELALELFGAKAASEFVREVWQAATPEVKQRLADAVIERLHAHLADRTAGWSMDRVIEQAAGRLIDGTLRKHASKVEQLAKVAVGDIVGRVVNEVERHAQNAVVDCGRRAAQDAIRAVVSEWSRR